MTEGGTTMLAQALARYGTLRFVETDELYSVYGTRDGDEIYLAHGTAKVLVAFEDLDFKAIWREWITWPGNRFPSGRYKVDEYLEVLKDSVIDPDDIDDYVSICDECSEPEDRDEMRWTGHETSVCDSCIQDYWFCVDCEEYYRSTTTTLNDTEVCSSCRDANWTYCGHCEGYRHDQDYEHDHEPEEPEVCCESPAFAFTVRNDGEPALGNDERVTVTLPAGVISTEGIDQIGQYLRDYAYSNLDGEESLKMRNLSWQLEEQLDNRWQTKQGNYTKRVSRLAYKDFGLKLPPEVVSRIGCIARDHSTAIDFAIEVTRDLNLPPEEFAHEDSCWWQSYTSSRCALKTNGGFGLRTFSGDYVRGRAWVMPLRLTEDGELTPTFETQNPDAFVVFNGYGDLEGYAPARIMSHMAGMTYRKIAFTSSPMYVNNNSGYLVAPEDIAAPYTDGSLSLYLDRHSNLYHTEERVMARAS